jgi:hypothetical protein
MSEADILDEPAPPAPKPRRRLLGCGLALLVVLTACGGFYGYLMHKFDRDLEEATAEADRLDPDGWRLDELEAHRKVVPDEENAALVVQKVKNNLPPPPAPWPLPRPVPATVAPGSTVFVENDLSELPPELQLDDSLVRDLRADLKAAGPAVDEANKLPALRDGRFPIDYPPDLTSPKIEPKIESQDARTVATLLREEAVLLAQEGRADKAMEATRGIVIAGRAVGDEPTLISQLIRLACQAQAVRTLERVLAQGEPSADELKKMQELLELEAAEPVLLIGVRGERAQLHELMNGLKSGRVTLSDATGGFRNEGRGIADALGGKMARGSQARLLRLMTEAVEAAKLPPEQQAEPMKGIETKAKQAKVNYDVLVALLMPAIFKVSDAYRREQAGLRCAIVAVAAERYRKDHGRWPAAPGELVPGYLKAVPTDPYDGKPLRWKALPDGTTVYSVGPDLEDNGGARNRGNPLAKGADYGFRLWDPAHRRRPPAEVLPPPQEDFGP